MHPDFCIPKLNLWREIKPNEQDVDEDIYRASLFVRNRNESGVFSVGDPAMNRYDVYHPGTAESKDNIEPCLISKISKTTDLNSLHYGILEKTPIYQFGISPCSTCENKPNNRRYD